MDHNIPDEMLSQGGHIEYIPELTELAQNNRKSPTEAEDKLWNEVLRNQQLNKYKFRRQKPIGQFILDFYCSELLLGIEVDGEYHNKDTQTEYDMARQEFLEQAGITVLRFTNHEVLNSISEVRQKILTIVPSLSGEGWHDQRE